MRLSWPQHLQVSRTLELSGDGERGMALALMGMSLLILAEDLLADESGHADGCCPPIHPQS